jgi:hypothetical protein
MQLQETCLLSEKLATEADEPSAAASTTGTGATITDSAAALQGHAQV